MNYDRKYLSIASYCESCFDKYGDNYLGVGWTKTKEDADRRYRVMLELIQEETRNVSLLDFGCGASHLYEYILQEGLENIEYSGLEISPKFFAISQKKFPSNRYYHFDVLHDKLELPIFDYIIMNGVFTMKLELSFDEMFEYLRSVITTLFSKVRVGIAFNVTSKLVDWERDDLFHLPFDALASFLQGKISRYFVIRHDYGLYEYTTYVYKNPI